MVGFGRITGVMAAAFGVAGTLACPVAGRKGRGATALSRLIAGFAVTWFASAALSPVTAADEGPKGSVTGLPLPRYVSLKSDRVNLRQGPNKDHATIWVYHRVGLPMEITAEFETWRRVRDSEGVEGWVLHSLLSGKRTALVAPWEKAAFIPMYRENSETSRVAARLEPAVTVQVEGCDKVWCQVEVSKRKGFVRQDKLWGVYPGETFN